MTMKNLLKNKSFCVLPWVHLNGHPDGSVHLCCFSNNKFSVGSILNDTLENIANNPKMQEIRRNMLNGTPLPSCTSCYEKENSKQQSFRQYMNNTFKKEVRTIRSHKIKKFRLRYLDLRFNNTCNFSCRSCSGEFSTSWYKEEKVLFNIERKFSKDISSTFIKEILPYITSLERVYLGGGEPLLAKETSLILKSLSDARKLNIPITINTNMSYFQSFALKNDNLLKQFKNITILASLDAEHGRAEYIRYGTKWKEVYKNLEYLRDNFKNIKLEANCTISILNIHTFTDLYLSLLKDSIIQENNFKCNILHLPLYLRADILPKEQKKIVIEKIKRNSTSVPKKIKKDFISVVNFLSKNDYSFLIDDFLKNCTILDESRNESLFNACPELSFLNQI